MLFTSVNECTLLLWTMFLIVFALLREIAACLHSWIFLRADTLVVRAVHVRGGEHGTTAWVGQHVGRVYGAVLGLL